MRYFVLMRLLCCVFALPLYSQPDVTPLQKKVAQSLNDYFKLDRENIHLHLNKNVYLTQESIWYTGYIIEKKYRPTFQTTNVFVELLGENGQQIASQLHFAESNLFQGYISLDQSLASGRYYLRTYTNYMNNFAEDESSLYPIILLNPNEKNYNPSQAVNYESVTLTLRPESGTFLSGVSNTFGARLNDCNGNGIALSNIAVATESGNPVTTFSTDAHGFGKFEIIALPGQTYRVSYTLNGKKSEQLLPAMAAKGIVFSATNCLYPDKVIVNVKTNQATRAEVKPAYTLVFQQNEACAFVDFSFPKNALEQRVVIPSTSIPEGTNAIYLIDDNRKKLGERMIYNPSPMTAKTLLNVMKKRHDSIVINGSTPLSSGTLSISILPDNNNLEPGVKSIQADLRFDNYLAFPLCDADYYTNNWSRKKHFELDNLLLTQNSKYDWDRLMGDAPRALYDADIGLTIKGTVNNVPVNKKDYKVNLNSLSSGLNELTEIGDKNDFVFEHVLALDSTKIFFPLRDKLGKTKAFSMSFNVMNNNRKFIKSLVMKPECKAPVQPQDLAPLNLTFPKIANAIALDSIAIVKRKDKLTYQTKPGNIMARGFKITEADVRFHRNVLDFIGSNGFDVNLIDGQWIIQPYPGRRKVRLMRISENDNMYVKYSCPAVYLDNRLLQTADELQIMGMENIDEIYIRRDGSDITVPGSVGIIKIYSKKGYSSFNVDPSDKSASLVIKNGFQKYRAYQNPKYDNVRGPGFLQFGTIDWKPIVETDQKGTFHFSIPNLFQKSVRVIIEGLSANGEMVSESLLLNLE